MKIMAVDIGGTAIKYGLVNENGEILDFGECETEAKRGGAFLMQKVISLIEQYTEFDLIGVSTAGQVNPVSGSISFASENIPGYTGTKVKDILRGHFNVPVAVENDVNSAALGEAYLGAGINEKSFICLTYGTGIGGAIIENGTVYTGTNFCAGEFGHLVTHGGGRECGCGGRGCYEQYGSTTALVRLVEERVGERLNGREIFARMNQGDKVVKNAIKEWIDEIIYGLVTLVHIFNPSCIVTGGGIMNEQYINDYINFNLKERVMPTYRNVIVKKAALGNKAGLLGAAINAKNRLQSGQ